ncbi:MAG: M4 family metallopeptidase [bacterium]
MFEYYENVHGRKAIDGKGSTIFSIVHITEEGQSMGNAFWSGNVMAYGDGNALFKPLAVGLDVAGHELTHGVIQHTVNLEYKFQSGALNESLADVFGDMVVISRLLPFL